MKVREVSYNEDTDFTPFAVRIEIESFRELEALRAAAAHLPDGMGIPLHDVLENIKWERF